LSQNAEVSPYQFRAKKLDHRGRRSTLHIASYKTIGVQGRPVKAGNADDVPRSAAPEWLEFAICSGQTPRTTGFSLPPSKNIQADG
jgi:hypothetical protein